MHTLGTCLKAPGLLLPMREAESKMLRDTGEGKGNTMQVAEHYTRVHTRLGSATCEDTLCHRAAFQIYTQHQRMAGFQIGIRHNTVPDNARERKREPATQQVYKSSS